MQLCLDDKSQENFVKGNGCMEIMKKKKKVSGHHFSELLWLVKIEHFQGNTLRMRKAEVNMPKTNNNKNVCK